MNKEFLLLGGTLAGLSTLGVLAILAVIFGRPKDNNEQVILQIVTVLSPTIIALVGAFKSIETDNKVTTKVIDLKSSVDGNTQHLEKQAIKVDQLNTEVQNVKVAASVAAQTAVNLEDKVNKLNGA